VMRSDLRAILRIHSGAGRHRAVLSSVRPPGRGLRHPDGRLGCRVRG
jgi:hypothetical protein